VPFYVANPLYLPDSKRRVIYVSFWISLVNGAMAVGCCLN
jgi:hypothetical protein